MYLERVNGNVRFWTGFTHSFPTFVRQHFSEPSQSLSLLQKSAFPAIVGSAGHSPGYAGYAVLLALCGPVGAAFLPSWALIVRGAKPGSSSGKWSWGAAAYFGAFHSCENSAEFWMFE
ncbi:hypothetical protein M514_27844 [Trichuris suis]|uniref:Uncharacterized protein n=1 Tax=Trichuris suis TaxID=68888 RepID=A0A085MRX6_9BILA|nr:hypothetical protein M514_27844 [Trichuris suis]